MLAPFYASEPLSNALVFWINGERVELGEEMPPRHGLLQ